MTTLMAGAASAASAGTGSTARDRQRAMERDLVLSAYQSLRNAGGYVTAGTRKIASMAGVSQSKASRLTGELVAQGRLERMPRPPRAHQAQQYRVLDHTDPGVALEPAWSQHGLGLIARDVWLVLDDCMGSTVKSVMDRTGCSRPTASARLRLLESVGLAVRGADRQWRRTGDEDTLSRVTGLALASLYELALKHNEERSGWRMRLAMQAQRDEDREAWISAERSSKANRGKGAGTAPDGLRRGERSTGREAHEASPEWKELHHLNKAI